MSNALYLLAAIVALSLATIAAAVVLVVTGNRADVAPVTGIIMPVILALMALKSDLARRQADKTTQSIETQVKKLNGINDAKIATIQQDIKEIAAAQKQP